MPALARRLRTDGLSDAAARRLFGTFNVATPAFAAQYAGVDTGPNAEDPR